MIKKTKKWLSLFLALVMALSATAVGMTAFAAPTEAAKDVADQIAAMKTPADLTDKLAADYKALTNDADQDSIDVLLVYKIYNFCFQNWLATTNPSTAKSKTLTTLGGYTKDVAAGIKLGFIFQGGTTFSFVNPDTGKTEKFNIKLIDCSTRLGLLQRQACIDQWNAASERVKSVANLCEYENFNFLGDLPLIKGVNKQITLLDYKYYIRGNDKTPEQIQSYFINEYSWDAPELAKPYLIAAATAADEYNKFLQGTDGMNDEAFYAKYRSFTETTLPNSDTVPMNKEQMTIFALLSDNVMTSVNVADVVSKVQAEVKKIEIVLAEKKLMTDFCALVNATDISAGPSKELNKVIASLRVQAPALAPNFNLDYIAKNDPATYAKYKQIMTMLFNDVTVKEGTAHNIVHPEETVDYKLGVPYGDIITQTLLPSVDAIANKLLPSVAGGNNLKGLVEDLLFTNANVKPIVMLLAGIGGSVATPKQVAELMANFPDKAEVAARLDKCGDSWDNVSANFDWGVTKGDYQSFFLTIFTTSAIPGLAQEQILANKNIYDANGVLTAVEYKGAYETVVIPLLEALGAKNVMNSTEYSAKTDFAGNATLAEQFAPLMIIVDQLYNQVITPLLLDPVGYLSTNLPNLVYHLEEGCVFDSIKQLINDLASLLQLSQDQIDAITPYLSLEGIMGALTPILDKAGIQLDLNDILKFARLGKATEVPTATMDKKTTIQVVGNRDSVVRQLAKIAEPILLKLLDDAIGLNFNPAKEFVKVEAPKYPHNGKMDKKVMNAMIAGFDGLIGGFVKLDEVINNGLCTPEMAANAITGIYGLLASLDLTSVGIALPVKPADVAKMLAEEKYDDLVADLNVKTNNWNDVGLVIKNDSGLIHQTDMGFKAGDRQGFVDCIVASLRPLVKMLVDANLVVNTVGEDGTQNYGLYETLIIPTFEAIGLTPAATSATYTKNFELLMKKVPVLGESATPAQKQDALEKSGVAYDYLAKTILNPVLGLLEDLTAAPMDTLLKVLPNVAYALQYNPQLAFIGNLLRNDSGEIDLAGMINPLLSGLIPGFELPFISLDALASCGTVETKTGKGELRTTYQTVTADKADAFVTVYYYLYDAINYKDNLNNIKEMLGKVEGIDPALMGLINSLLNEIFTASKEESLCKLGALLASDVWECPDTADDSKSNSGKKTPSTGDYAIPAAAFLAVMFSAGAAIVLLRRKKTNAQ